MKKTRVLQLLAAIVCLPPALSCAQDIANVRIPALPPGKSITVFFDAAVSRPVTVKATTVSARAEVSGANVARTQSGAVVFALDNAEPVFTSGITAAPNPAFVGQPIQFGAAPVDENLDTLSYLWDFGDGTTETIGQPSRAFTTPGIYSVGLVVDDGRGGIKATSIEVAVWSAVPGDPDGDRFDSFIEEALGADAMGGTSRPFDLAVPTDGEGLVIKRLQIRTSAARPKNNTLKMTGTIPVPAGVSTAGKIVIVAVGKVVRSFSIDSKGRGEQGKSDTIRFSKPKKSASQFTLKLSRGSFSTVERENGDVRVIVYFSNKRFEFLAPAK